MYSLEKRPGPSDIPLGDTDTMKARELRTGIEASVSMRNIHSRDSVGLGGSMYGWMRNRLLLTARRGARLSLEA